MKNQYFGDVGDYGKYGLLRALALNGISIAVNWYLTDDVTENDGSSDGKFTQYLNEANNRTYCPEVFDLLYSAVVDQQKRDISLLEKSNVIPNARYFNERVPELIRVPKEKRAMARNEWHKRGLAFCGGADLVFLDPDNGLRNNLTNSSKLDVKYVLCEEAVDYYSGANLLYYCHKGRRSDDEWRDYKKLLALDLPDAKLFGLTFHRGTQRSFVFVVHPEDAEKYIKIKNDFLDTPWKKMFSFEKIDCFG